MKKILCLLLFCATFSLGSVRDVRAEYPYDRPLNIIVPFGPGGAVDIASRILAEYFQKNFNINVNVLNKPGGAMAIGVNEMLRARPDGYTLVFPGFGVCTTPKLTNVGFTMDSLKPVAQITVMDLVFSTNTASGIDTFQKFIQTAEKDLENTVYASTGAITTQRLFMTKLLRRFHPNLKIRHAAYGSGHEVSTALLGKHITAGFQVLTNVKPYAESGDFKLLAISRTERLPNYPNLPTFREIYADQLKPEDEKWISLGSWHGLLASNKVSDESIEKLQPLLQKALTDPEVIEKFHKIGLSIDYLAPRAFGEAIKASSNLIDEVLEGRKSLD